MIDGNEVKRMLAERAFEVCSHLFPAGKKDGSEFKVGDLNGSPGSSLCVALQGNKAGVWSDFSTGDKGANLLDLWMRAKELEFKEAIREAKDWLGVRDDPKLVRRRLSVDAPRGSRELELVPVVEGGAVWRWLTEVRGLTGAAIRRYRIGEARFPLKRLGEKPIDWVVFPFFDVEGKLVRLKYRDVAEKRNTFQAPSREKAEQYVNGYQKLLFGWQAGAGDELAMVLVEGELDAMAWWQATGMPALSLPEGAQVVDESSGEKNSPHDAWIEHDHEAMVDFVEVVLAGDSDEVGRSAQKQIAPRLGMERCSVVSWPEGVKDANGAVLAGVDVGSVFAGRRGFDPEELRRPSDFAREIWEDFYPELSTKPKGAQLPFNLPFEFRPEELVVWHGYNGHGKTILMSHCLVDIAAQGQKVLIASLEMPAHKTFKNMTRQVIGRGRPGTEAALRRSLGWMDEWFFVYDKVGEANSLDVLEVFKYAFRKYGVRHFVLDSLMMLQDVPENEYPAQGVAIKLFKEFARDHGVTVHMVCHSKKPSEKRPEAKKCPSKYDISGAAALSNVPESIVAVWRNKEKEENLRQAKWLESMGKFQEASDLRDKWCEAPDAQFQVQKQRETGEEPGRFLYFDGGADGSLQFMPKRGDAARIYVEAGQ
jgi:twinkle protein